jgi:uncharacterized protein
MASSPPHPSPDRTLHRGFRIRPFRPAPWLPGPHLQTVGGKLLRPRSVLPLARVRIDTPDGDFLDLDVAPEPRGGPGPVVVVLHGLEGSTRRGYVRLAMAELRRQGLQPVGMNFRSCSGEPNRRPRFYHSGETSDLDVVLEWLRGRFPDRPVGALGFSLGGNVLLKYLGEGGGGARERLAAAAAISVPFDLVAGTRAIESGAMGRLYTYYFIRSLRRKAEAKAALLDGIVDLELVRRARTLQEYDQVATAPLHGFPGAHAYYEEASSARFLEEIRTPTLLLQSEDDPFLPSEAIPRQGVTRNPYLLPAFTPEGGHVGFVSGPTPWQARFWAEGEAARYLSTILLDP